MKIINSILRFLCDISAYLIGLKTSFVESYDRVIEGNIKIRIYKPVNSSIGPKVVVYYHGGGWILGSIKSYDAVMQFLSFHSNSIIIAVNYKKAPEYEFPAAVNDAYISYNWILENIIEVNNNPKNLIICGDSAGGGLSINLLQILKQQNKPTPFKLILIYPLLTTKLTKRKGYNLKVIIHKFSEIILQYCIKQYISNSTELMSPYLSILNNFDAQIHPETFIIAGEYDALNPEIVSYFLKLKENNIKVSIKEYENQLHGFINFARFSKGAKLALHDISNFIRCN